MTKKITPLEQASRLIRTSHYPLLICHISPDGDAIGSLMGLTFALQRLGHAPIAACSDPIHSRFDFIPGIETVVQDVSTLFDLIISLDCSDMRRVGHFTEMPGFEHQTLLNIDHHATNTGFGDVNLVDPQASSTAEVVLRLLEHMGVPINDEIATALLAGIVTDTRGFRTNNVTPDVMDAARRLMEAGASLNHIARSSLDHRPTVAIRLWGAALSDLQIEDGVIWTAIPASMRQAVGYKGSGDAGLSSFLVSADEADVSVVFVERDDGRVEVGLRAVPGFDVAQLALQFGGGGHALAAGFNTAGPLDDAQDRVLTALRADVARQREDYA